MPVHPYAASGVVPDAPQRETAYERLPAAPARSGRAAYLGVASAGRAALVVGLAGVALTGAAWLAGPITQRPADRAPVTWVRSQCPVTATAAGSSSPVPNSGVLRCRDGSVPVFTSVSAPSR